MTIAYEIYNAVRKVREQGATPLIVLSPETHNALRLDFNVVFDFVDARPKRRTMFGHRYVVDAHASEPFSVWRDA